MATASPGGAALPGTDASGPLEPSGRPDAPDTDAPVPGASAHGSPGGMTAPVRYPVPAGTHRVEEELRRSRFITTIHPAPDEDTARARIREVREEFPDATHHCWAFLAGPPGSTARVGMSDDGEPHGTAGRPILNALLHAGVGDVVAVVTRFYGGVKLGKGGLGRAYSGGVQRALEGLPRTERVERFAASVRLEYFALEGVRRLLAELDVEILEERFDQAVELELAVPEDRGELVSQRLADLTSGGARFLRLHPPHPSAG
jgi:uncharacterized YigZ family protein